MELQDRVVVVTGGASGIGAALCRRFAREAPAALVVVDRDAAGAEDVAAEVGGTAVVADLATAEGVARALDAAERRHGPIEVYCSNAGILVDGGPATVDDAWQRAWDVNLMAHVRAARRLLPGWLARGEGCFVGTVSAAALLNHLLAAPYAATKAAALSFLEWLAITHGGDGVVVSAVCPEGVRTSMLDATSEFLAATALDPEAVADAVADGVRDERFLILPHPRVAEHAARRGADHDRWIAGMRRFRDRLPADQLPALEPRST